MSENTASYFNSAPLTLADLDRMIEAIKAIPPWKPDKIDIYATDLLVGRVMEVHNEHLKPELSRGRTVVIVPRAYQLTAYKIFRDAGHEVRLFFRDPGAEEGAAGGSAGSPE